MIGLFFRFCFRLSLDHKPNVSDVAVSGVGRKWKRSDSSDTDSVALITPLMTPIFDFPLGISARSYDSAFDSDSVASENQPLHAGFYCSTDNFIIMYVRIELKLIQGERGGRGGGDTFFCFGSYSALP